MGTMIQSYKLEEKDYRGERFAQWEVDLKGNNDLLSLTQPDIIKAIHSAYFEAGSDIVETNTFNSTTHFDGRLPHGIAWLMKSMSSRHGLPRQAAEEYSKNAGKTAFCGRRIRPDQPHRIHVTRC